MGRPRTSTREMVELVGEIAPWLAGKVGADGIVEIEDPHGPDGAGFSSETVLLDARWTSRGEPHSAAFVVRLPPPADAFPLFPRYEAERQVSAMRYVRDNSAVPVPAVPWFETDESILDVPFYVMERVDGLVVGDVPPYVFGSWVTEASAGERTLMRSGMVDVLVGIHGLASGGGDLTHWELDAPGATPLERHVANQRAYYDWVRGDGRFPLIERTFDWLEARWPEPEGDAVLSWGDSRLANVLWREFRPVAVIDWEAVAVGPRELDLGWLIFHHEFFQRIAERYGHAGVPDLLARDETVALYAERSRHEPRDLDWYLVYAELRQALTSIRVSSRAVHFGERDAPQDPEDLIMQRDHLEEVLDT